MTTHPADRRSPRRGGARLAILAALTALLALAGCGSSSKSTTTTTSSAPASTPATSSSTTSTPSAATSSGASLALSAAPGGQLEYSTKSLTAAAGKVTIAFTNSSPLGHNVTIESSSGQTLGATPTFQGGTKSLSLNLKPGTYKFFCSVPGHRQAGMEGTLVVK